MTEGLVLGIDEIPLALQVFALGGECPFRWHNVGCGD
jgi:hypothetical protein